MTDKPFRVMTRGGQALVVNVKTLYVLTSFPLLDNPYAPHVNCDRCLPGYMKAKAFCDRLNNEHLTPNHNNQHT